MKIRHEPDAVALRRRAYPDIGDQLDAVMQMADALRRQGIELPPATLEWIEQCRAVKARYPKTNPRPA